LIRNFNELSSSKVLGVADLRQDRLQSIQNSYPHMSTTRDYHDLFEMKLDAVVVATPPTTHYKIARDALEHGLHVLVEKPLTLNCQQAEELIELAERKNLILMVGHTFIFNAAVQNLKRLIQSGDLGQIYYIDTARLNLGLYQNGLDVLWDLAPHDISILLYLLDNEPISICARGMECVVKGIHDVVFIDLVFPDNILAHIHVSWLDPCKVRRVTVVGNKKMVVYNDVEALDKIKIFDRGIEMPAYTRDFAEFQCSYRYGDILIPNIKFSEPLRKECQHFLDCISDQCQPITNAREGLKVVKILEAAEHSLENSSYQEVLA
jgi:predicted dehydrogenase